MEQWDLVIVTGNPGVFQGYPYPLPRVGVSPGQGKGSQGFTGFHRFNRFKNEVSNVGEEDAIEIISTARDNIDVDQLINQTTFDTSD